jgi:thiol-disulfide isomerase/thioredoxin
MNKKLKKELIEYGVLIGIVAVLFVTGWYKDVAGFLQRGLLETGLMKPTISEETRAASYDFQLVTMGGRTVNFDEFEGKIVFMNFWATWCPPCIAEMPDINSLYAKVGEEVSFVMLSLDNDPQKAIEFIERKGFDFPVYFLKTDLPPTYKTNLIPSTYVLSPDGKIVSEHHGMAKYDTKSFREFLLGLGKVQSPS